MWIMQDILLQTLTFQSLLDKFLKVKILISHSELLEKLRKSTLLDRQK